MLNIGNRAKSISNEVEASKVEVLEIYRELEERLTENASRFDLSEEAAAQFRLFQKIPAGHYFVLGDNRTHSSDSRTFGFVEIQAIEGIVIFKMAPFKEIGKVK
ncbi:signal peptidase I [Enterococcus faecalis]|nr:signal peptidase I [Enterococcus faecalis]MDN3072242.1 signal peptidase I [Enterococcus faecalis]